ncbi:ATP-binding cassette domain-containing protein [Ruminococcus sp. NK3A76]|uniref:ATP-binding cassette domain-containing protein n=1 Tax=Ruminococcus sp. NK3A76 TaxID=877411 RepID=UPI00048AA47B|nr:ATP-binding cassette domain-containing protein [Ruminococcus sp. NK3A76]
MSTIVIENVTKKLKGKTILDNVNLNFEGGQIYGLVGKNGSGKTMLLRLISGLIFADEGSVIINGKQLHKDISFPESCGVIIENTELLPSMTAYDNLKILSNIKNTASDEMIVNALINVGLDPKNDKKVKSFSLGMKQRLSIAQAIFENPDILLLDEPTNALDDEGVELIRKLLTNLRDIGKIILIASHNKEDISLLADKVIKVTEGKFSC